MRKFSKIFLVKLFVLLFCELTFANKQEPIPSNIFEIQNFTSHNVEKINSAKTAASYLFNGTNSYIEFNEQFDKTFSFCAWIKPADLLKKNMSIVGIPGAFWLRTTTNRELQFTQPGVSDDNTTGLLLSADNWIFVSFVINYPSAKIYLNSKLVGEFQWGRKKQEWQNQVLIGKDNWREDFHGSMQNIQIFKNVIDKNTINKLFEERPYSESITDGIVLYHSFNASKKFYTKGEYSETFNVSFLRDSLRGNVSEFNGKDSYIDFGELPVDNAVTISAWVKQNEFNRDYGAIAALGHAYAFRITTGGALLFTIPQMADVLDNDARIVQDKWQHIAMTFKEQYGVTFYLNGVKTDFHEIEKYQPVPKELQVGTNLWNDFYKGQIDDLIVWNKILSDTELKEIFKKESRFWEEHIKTKRTGKLGVFGLLSILLILGCTFYVWKRRKHVVTTSESLDPFEQEISETVLQNLSDSKFSVNEFAAAMNMSKTKLYNEIKASVNKSPKEYIRAIRIIEAARLLKETNIPVTEVIFETGFESRAYFNKCFKEIYNLTPSEYRKTNL